MVLKYHLGPRLVALRILIFKDEIFHQNNTKLFWVRSHFHGYGHNQSDTFHFSRVGCMSEYMVMSRRNSETKKSESDYRNSTDGYDYPDRSGVYLQCHAVYTAATLQPMQCTCSIGCSYTADTLQTAVYTVTTLHVHCSTLQVHCYYTAGTLQLAVYTANTLQNGLLQRHFVHCTYTASKWQCTCSVRAAYTAATLELYCLYTPLRSG